MRRSERGEVGLLVVLSLGFVVLLVLVGWLFVSRGKSQELAKVLDSNGAEIAYCGGVLAEAFAHVEALSRSWEMTTVRRNVTELSIRLDQLQNQLSRQREDAARIEQDGADARTIMDVLAQAKISQVRIGELTREATAQVANLDLSRRLTDVATGALVGLTQELDRIRTLLAEQGGGDDLSRTQLELLETGKVQHQSLFVKGINALMDDEPNGRSAAQAAIYKMHDLTKEAGELFSRLGRGKEKPVEKGGG
jgi:hypothetical protein